MNLNKLGGDMHDENIRCRKCPTLRQAGFSPDYGIILCANNIRGQGKIEDNIAHGK